MPISRIAIGNASEFQQADALKAALAEFISMLIFVFAGEGSGMAYSKGQVYPPILVEVKLAYFLLINHHAFDVVLINLQIS